MDKNNLQRAAGALAGLCYMEWEVLREQVERQFHMKFSRMDMSGDEAAEISGRIEREWAGSME